MAKLTVEGLNSLSPIQILELILKAVENYDLDETAGDWTERAETIQWLASYGKLGRDWGHR